MELNWTLSITSWASHPWTLFTNSFCHKSTFHLLFDMVAVWTIGKHLLTIMSPSVFFSFYLLAAFGGSCAHLIWSSIIYDKNIYDRMNDYTPFVSYPVLPDGTPLSQEQVDVYKTLYNNQFTLQSSEYTYRELYNPLLGASSAVFGMLGATSLLWPRLQFSLSIMPLHASSIVVGLTMFEVFSLLVFPKSNTAHSAHLGGLTTGILSIILMRRFV